MLEKFREDIRIFREKHRGQGLYVYFYYPDFRVIVLYRFSNWLFRHKMKPFAYLFTAMNDLFHGVWIGPRVEIGKGVSFGHPRGLVINPNTIIGNYCTFLNGITLGGPNVKIGDFVEVGASACVISKKDRSVTIGAHCIVGAGAVLTKSVPPFSIVVGNPARVIKEKNLEEWLVDRPYYRGSIESV